MTKKEKTQSKIESNIDTKKILSTDNDMYETLTYEEQQWIKAYQNRMFEKELHMYNVAY